MSQQRWFSTGRISLLWVGCVLVAAISLLGANAAAATYTIVDLATLTPGQAVVVRGPNIDGVAAGAGKVVSDVGGIGGRRGLLFRSGGAAVQIPGLAAETDDSAVFQVNDAGAFVGTANTITAMRAFIGTPAGS